MYAPPGMGPIGHYSVLFSEELWEGPGVSVMAMDMNLQNGCLTKREALGPISVLVRSIHFRGKNTNLCISLIFCFCGATLLYACQNLGANL